MVLAGGSAEQSGREPASRRARFEQADRETPRHLRRGQAARRLHQIEPAGKTAPAQLGLDLRDVAVHQRLHKGIGEGRGGALVLAQFRDHLRRQRDRDLGELAGGKLGNRPLMHRVAIGVEERDGDRLDTCPRQRLDLDAHLVEIERAQHPAVTRYALVDLAPQRARRQRLGEFEKQVVDVVTLLDPHLDDVAEALGGQQSDLGAAALDDRIGDECGAVHEIADFGEVEPGVRCQFHQPGQRAQGRVARGGQAFVQPQRSSRVVDQDQVSEGAADVEADPIPGSTRRISGELCVGHGLPNQRIIPANCGTAPEVSHHPGARRR